MNEIVIICNQALLHGAGNLISFTTSLKEVDNEKVDIGFTFYGMKLIKHFI